MSNPELFDVHTHAHFAEFKGETDAVIKRALDRGVWLINVGTQKDTSVLAVKYAGNYPDGVYATVGLHPIHTEASYHDNNEFGEDAKGFISRAEEFDYDYYRGLAQNEKVAAIGECGLDYYRLTSETREKQKEVFIKQIELAKEVGKPLMVHCRNSFSDLIEILASRFHILDSNSPGIIHFFTGSVDDAKKLMTLGFSFSFGGVITFTRDYDGQIKYIPLDRIVLETDAPYVAPIPYRGKRNEPAYVAEVAKKLAEIKNISFEETAKTTLANARKIFRI